MKGFVLTLKGIVPTEWIDKNDHMNVTSYMALFDQGTDIMLEKSGLIGAEADSDITVVAGRIFIEHRRELLKGEEWVLWSGFTAVESSFMTITHRLHSGTSLRAACDIRGTAFSKHSRTTAKLENESLCKAMTFLVPGLIDRFEQKYRPDS